jgi:hypothetical protein
VIIPVYVFPRQFHDLGRIVKVTGRIEGGRCYWPYKSYPCKVFCAEAGDWHESQEILVRRVARFIRQKVITHQRLLEAWRAAHPHVVDYTTHGERTRQATRRKARLRELVEEVPLHNMREVREALHTRGFCPATYNLACIHRDLRSIGAVKKMGVWRIPHAIDVEEEEGGK